MVLVALLLGSVLVAVTYEVVNNLWSSSRNVVEKVELYNAAVEGIEKGKIWLRQTAKADGYLPSWEASNPYGEITHSDLTGGSYNILLVKDIDGNLPGIDYTKGNINVTIEIFDMSYMIGNDVQSDDYISGFPPRLYYEYTVPTSMHQGSTYAGSNRGEGSTGSGTAISLGYYLIRSQAQFEDRTEIVEQSVIARL